MSLSHIIDASETLTEAANAGDTAGILEAVNSKSIQRTSSELQTVRSIIVRYGMVFSSRVIAGFKTAAASNPLLDAMLITLSSTGLNFSDALTQQTIDDLADAGVFSEPDAELLRKLGVWQESIADQQLGREATEQDVLDAVSEWKKLVLSRYLASRSTVAAAAIANGTATSENEVNSAFTG